MTHYLLNMHGLDERIIYHVSSENPFFQTTGKKTEERASPTSTDSPENSTLDRREDYNIVFRKGFKCLRDHGDQNPETD